MGPPDVDRAAPDGVADRLAELEASLREVADEISAARATLARGEPSASPDRATPAQDEPTTSSDPSPPAGRARLRQSPLEHLFRSSTTGIAHEAPAEPPLPPLRDGDELAAWLDERTFAVDTQRARMVVTSERLLGREHPDTLWAAHDLASELARAGEVVRARALAAYLVEVRSRLLGADHPFAARARELLEVVS